ncbi:hypothetical protein G4Y79_16750 [Phototrophicus methaneseepsis]|uniref:Bacterial transcriptional activator domain-containing protein n=1 Tax=Phototrophicus methaneseepsis TaxID=2710758 RepID=A0A7S8E6R5_9CHLR|nr:BTAD domain-containing putative transcriptional regulator [Phototrophicus methaneseepsis]QPC81338.1 hypothetical protein G4Y79_16750 [Phototrophicus methaneseepsis]
MNTKNSMLTNQPHIRIVLFGPPQIFINGKPGYLKRRKSYELLAYLAVNKRPYSREYLASLLWPDVPDKTASTRLRNLLTDIRSVITDDNLICEGDVVILDNSIEVDVQQFEASAQPFYEGQNRGLSPNTLRQLEQATHIYTDHFLSGFNSRDSAEFDDWKYIFSEKYFNIVLGMFAALANHYFVHSQAQEMYSVVQRWLSFEPLSEEAHRLLIKLYLKHNRPDKALHQYHMLARMLERQEGVQPLPETMELYEVIRSFRTNTHHAVHAVN